MVPRECLGLGSAHAHPVPGCSDPHVFHCAIQIQYFLCGIEADCVTAFPRVHSWSCQCLRLLFDAGCGAPAPVGVGGRWEWQPGSSHGSGAASARAGYSKLGCRYLWFGFLGVLWIAKI